MHLRDLQTHTQGSSRFAPLPRAPACCSPPVQVVAVSVAVCMASPMHLVRAVSLFRTVISFIVLPTSFQLFDTYADNAAYSKCHCSRATLKYSILLSI